MKKVVLGSLLAAVCGLTYAQSNVSFYGAIGNSATSAKRGTASAVSQQQNASRDYLGTTRLGITGTEDLGGGTTASFKLEGDLNGASGTLGTADATFNRFSYVELANKKLGKFSMGRQNDSIKDMSDIGGGGYNLSDTESNGMLVGSRYTMVSKYVTPTVAGFNASYSYSNNPADTNTSSDGTKTLNSYGITYKGNNGLTVAYASGKITEVGVTDKQTDRIAVSTKVMGATVGGSYNINKQGENKTKQTTVSASVPFYGSYEFKTHYVKQDVQGAALTTQGKDGDGYGAMLVKNFSKRTAVYAAYYDFKGTQPSGDTRITTAGILHKF